MYWHFNQDGSYTLAKLDGGNVGVARVRIRETSTEWLLEIGENRQRFVKSHNTLHGIENLAIHELRALLVSAYNGTTIYLGGK